MTNSDVDPPLKTGSHYGRCDICGVCYGSETLSVQHMMSLKHHKRYDTAQRSLGLPVSHFCPVCGIGGIKNIDEWSNHVRSALHTENYEHFMQISNAQKKALRRQRSDKTTRTEKKRFKLSDGKLKPPNNPNPPAEVIQLGRSSSPCSGTLSTSFSTETIYLDAHNSSDDTGNSPPSQNYSKAVEPIDSIGKVSNSSSRSKTNEFQDPLNHYQYYHPQQDFIPPPTFSPHYNDYSHRGYHREVERRWGDVPACYGAYRRNSDYPSLVFGYNRERYSSPYGRNFSGHPQFVYKTYQPPIYHPSLAKQRTFHENERVNNNLQTSTSTAGNLRPALLDLPLQEHAKSTVIVNPPTSDSQEHPKELPSQQRHKLTPDILENDFNHPATSNAANSTTFAKMHEVWELSEALDKLKQQQFTLNHYIQQLKHIRQQKKEEKKLLLDRRSALLREMDQPDSPTDSHSSDSSCAVDEQKATRNGQKITPTQKPLDVISAINVNNPTDDPLQSVHEVQQGPSDETTAPPTAPKRATRRRPTRKSQPSANKQTVSTSIFDATSRIDNLDTADIGRLEILRKSGTVKTAASDVSSQVDLERLRWIREMINNPASLQYTFDELDKLVEEVNIGTNLRESGTPVAKPP